MFEYFMLSLAIIKDFLFLYYVSFLIFKYCVSYFSYDGLSLLCLYLFYFTILCFIVSIRVKKKRTKGMYKKNNKKGEMKAIVNANGEKKYL